MTADNDRHAYLGALLALRPGETMADRLEEFIRPPAWHRHAACAGMGPGAFYPEGRGSSPAAGLEVCARCPVVDLCAEAGEVEPFGTWGGRSEGQRRAIRSSGRLRPPAA